MPETRYTVLFNKNRTNYKLCKIIFGADGSYYVTVPYHSANKGVFLKYTVNYSKLEMVIPFQQALDMASGDQSRIKLSHHPDGFIQFSGKGLISGKDKDGSIRGMGVMSWPLTNPVHGPAFGIVILGVDEFEQESRPKGKRCIFYEEEMPPIPGANGLALEGHYFPAMARRFIRNEQDGSQTMPIVHPLGIVMHLKVVLAPDTCELPGFIGLNMFPSAAFIGNATSGFLLGGSTGNIRFNEQKEKLGDGISCVYPRLDEEGIRRILDYTNA
jgi:hypothetical protein